jgi:GTP-binding protein
MAQKLPSVVIVGRPNVGKSTLFNRITGTRRSIVTDEPGITRDRIYGTATWSGRSFEVVDTGGIVPDEKAGIPGEILRQARVAIERAAQLVLVVDARAGLTPLDAELARLLRQTGRPLAVAANKVDTARMEAEIAPFYELGVPVFAVSSEHGLGVGEMLDALTAEFVQGEAAAEVAPEISVAIIGRPNVGKSTLLNRLVGEERAIVSPEAGTTRDAVDTVVAREGRNYRLIDTAGIRRKGKTKLVAEKLSVMMARRHLERADVALVLVDAEQGVTSNDATIAGYAQESGRGVIIVMNKWDLALEAAKRAGEEAAEKARAKGKSGTLKGEKVRKSKRGSVRVESLSPGTYNLKPAPERLRDPGMIMSDYEKIVRGKLKSLEFAPVIFLSALTGDKTAKLWALIDRVAEAHRRRVPTAELNRWAAEVDLGRASSPGARQVKIFYVTQASAGPPTFVLFTNQKRPLHFSFERFLQNQLREAFDFTGTPIRFHQRLKKR